MASRNYDGTVILKSANVRGLRHTGTRNVVGRSDTDAVVSRKNNTGYRLAKDGSTQIWVP